MVKKSKAKEILFGIAFAVMYILGVIEQEARPEFWESDNLVPVFLGMAHHMMLIPEEHTLELRAVLISMQKRQEK